MTKEKKVRTKAEFKKLNKRLIIIIIVLVIILVYLIAKPIIADILFGDDNDGTNENNETSEDDTHYIEYAQGIVYGILVLDYPFLPKFLIFLGIVYLIQVGISITGDIIELVLIIGVVIVKIIRWSYMKIKGIKDEK